MGTDQLRADRSSRSRLTAVVKCDRGLGRHIYGGWILWPRSKCAPLDKLMSSAIETKFTHKLSTGNKNLFLVMICVICSKVYFGSVQCPVVFMVSGSSWVKPERTDFLKPFEWPHFKLGILLFFPIHFQNSKP